MSTATAKAVKATDATEVPEAAPAKGKKKLIIIIAAAVLALALVGGGATWFLLKKKHTAAEAEGEEPAAAQVATKKDKEAQGTPVFVPLDPFTVNLADREAERYAQVGITLEIEDSKVGDQIKVYMPAIRNNILMAIADHTAGELMGREGKSALAERVKREVARALGVEVEEPGAASEAGPAEKQPARKARKGAVALPVKAVHFSNFIIQ
ncbi:MAG: flagellar basal body-associated FliL family protein [Rubrivivax sp.]|nr:flagellar basal body-associated FliL family protein [Rubrivivax sp.]